MTRVLLIEDEAPVREMLVDELTALGYDVSEAENGERGLEVFLRVEPDIVLCDRAMPGMSGYQVLERLRGVYPQYRDVPFVFLTALTDQRDKAAVEHLGADAYLEKPVDFDVLHQKIQMLIKRKKEEVRH